MHTPEQLALDNCSREPVHRPGRVQSFAGLIVFDPQSFEIIAHTTNIAEFVGSAVRTVDAPTRSKSGAEEGTSHLFGQRLGDLLDDRQLLHNLRGALGLPTIRTQRERLGSWQLGNISCDLAIHLISRLKDTTADDHRPEISELAILEIERLGAGSATNAVSVVRVRAMLSELDHHRNLDTFLNSAVRTLRRFTGFDRVMCYKFLPDDAGEVVAEAAAPGLDSFLGLRYPAYDIPPQVRQLALQIPIRVIGDIRDPHSELLNSLPEPIDMTYCYARGISPIHAEYLANMNVRSTMNLSIIVGGKLWGLFAFHHDHPRRLPPETRAIAELFGHFFSIQLAQELEQRSLEGRNRAMLFRQELKTNRYDSIAELLSHNWEDLVDLVQADGLAFVSSEAVVKFGKTPSNSEAIRLISQQCRQEICPIDSMVAIPDIAGLDEAELNGMAGVLSLIIDEASQTQLLFFRHELVSEVRWAGMPEKRIEFGPNGPRLHPRASFSEYRQTVRGRSAPWTQTDLRTAAELRIAMLEAVFHDTRTARDDWRKQKSYQDLLIAELNHRVKNILSLVRSISRQTKDTATSLEDFLATFDRRISALVTAHELIGGSGMQWASLRQLLEMELRPFFHAQHDVTLTGPSVALRDDITPVMALVIHELVSNTVKYGVLSSETGSLKVTWTSDASGLTINWKECQPGQTLQPRRSGFGLKLIERALPHECGGRASLAFNGDQFEANFWLPPSVIGRARDIRSLPDSSKNSQTDPIPQTDVPTFHDRKLTALILEDNAVLAFEVEQSLAGLGFQSVLTSGSQLTALEMLQQNKIDIAILDINLGRDQSFQIADHLLVNNIPFIFVSGYDREFSIPHNLKDIPRLNKPLTASILHRTIHELLSES